MIKYRWRLKIGSGAFATVSPRWSDEAKHVTSIGDGERYYRKVFDGELIFQRTDFDNIHAAAFDTEFRLLLQKQIDNGAWTSIPPVLRFWKTDIKFDYTNRTAAITPETFDQYDLVLGGKDKEYNLIDLEPETVELVYKKQAVIQVVLPDGSYMANFTDGIFWETPVPGHFKTIAAGGETITNQPHLDMLNVYGFGIHDTGGVFDYVYGIIPGTGDGLSPDVSGIYEARVYNANGIPGARFRRLDEVYEMDVFTVGLPFGQAKQVIRRLSDNVIVYETLIGDIPYPPYGSPPHYGQGLEFTSLTSSSKVNFYLYMPYVRMLTNMETVDGQPTIELPDDDPFSKGSFSRALPIKTDNFIYSDGHSTTATRWGKFESDELHFPGQYFTKPTSALGFLMPVIPTEFAGSSAWFYMDANLRNLQREGSETITILDAYKISECYKVLLNEITEGAVSHDDDSTYSDFFYASSNPIKGTRKVGVIVPKSNILIGKYEKPAQKAPIRLSDLIQLDRNFYNVFWFIGEGSFKREHVAFFDNGRTYAGQNVGLDLTRLREPKSKKAWGYRTDQYEYDKPNIPERIEFGMMDKQSQAFDGYPIQVVSKYAQKGKIDDKRIGIFSADIDFLHVSPERITQDGFMFFECDEVDGQMVVPFLELVVSLEETYTVQNGYCSFIRAAETYFKHGLPAMDVNINKSDTTATTVKRSRMQDITVCADEDFDPYELVTNTVGGEEKNGNIETIEQKVTSSELKCKLRHDNE